VKYIILSIIALAALGAVFFLRHDPPSASAQEPRYWRSGDTLWYEINKIPVLPSPSDMLIDSLIHRKPNLQPYLHSMSDSFPHSSRHYAPVPFDYKIPFWDVYRRSVTIWGITFSTGQASPLSPYPAEHSLDANVLSFPLPRTK
jgi:hypothetical protein